MTTEADWDYLPKLVKFSVLDKLYEAIDRINLGTVSKRWHVIAEEYKEKRLVHRNHKKNPPMLVVLATNNHYKRRLYSILEGKIYPKIHLFVPYEICIGSCFGWLAFANHKTFVTTLMNPFKKVDPIELPPIEFEHLDLLGSKFKIKKIILSVDPLLSPDGYVVVAIYGGDGQLTFLKSGQNKWGNICVEDWICFTDVILHKNIFYVVTNFTTLISFKVSSSSSTGDFHRVDQVNVLDETDRPSVPRVYCEYQLYISSHIVTDT